MASKNLYASIAGVTDVISIDQIEGYKSFSRVCNITCRSTSLNIGSSITVDAGYSDSHGVIFTGIVKKILTSVPDNLVTLTCFDTLIRATDYLMASEDPQEPFARQDIDATDLVEDLLNEAGITSFSASPSTFIFSEPEFNLVTVADAIGQINSIIAFHVWADSNGTVYFADRRPYVMGGDTPTHTFTTGSSGNIVTIEYSRSDDDLRNRVVVYGLDPVQATASTSSPYLPVGFFKTAAIASPLITEQQMAQDSADFNLELYNRLTREVSCEVLGDYTLHVNSIVTVTESNTGVTGDWFAYSVNHSWNDSGYLTKLVLRA